jgi:hypothetical protein
VAMQRVTLMATILAIWAKHSIANIRLFLAR